MLAGCTTFRKPPAEPKKLELSTIGCKPIPVDAKFLESNNMLFNVTSDYSKNQNPDWSAWALASRIVADRLHGLNILDIDSAATQSKDYKIIFHVLENYSSTNTQKVFYWMTTLSLGIIPSWGTGSIKLTAQVFDKDDIRVGIFESSAVEFNVYNSFLTFVYMYNYNAHIQYIERTVMKDLTDEVTSKMIAAKLICQENLK